MAKKYYCIKIQSDCTFMTDKEMVILELKRQLDSEKRLNVEYKDTIEKLRGII